MRYALNLAEDGRVLSATFEQYAAPEQPLVEELPDGDIADYVWDGSEFVLNPLPKPEPEPTPSTDVAALEAKVTALEEELKAAKILLGVDDEEATAE